MDDFLDYKNYSLEQLYDVARHINKEKFPERFALLEQEIQNKEREQAETPPTIQNPQKMRGGCLGGCAFVIVGIVAGVAISLLWINVWILFHPEVQIAARNMDGMNRWGGHVAAVMMGTWFGGIGGTCAAMSKEPIKTVVITTAIFAATLLVFSF